MTEPLLIQKMNMQMAYLSQRQALLARNIANIDTPNYQAQDLKKLDFDNMKAAESPKIAMRETSSKHIAGTVSQDRYASAALTKTFEKKPGGNTVVLEEQLGKVSDVGAQHQLTTSLLKKYHSLYIAALGRNSGS